MELVLEKAEGVPAGALLSLKVGDLKRQSDASKVGQGFRWTSAPETCAIKAEMLLPAAAPQIVEMKPGQERLEVDFGTMKVCLVRKGVISQADAGAGQSPQEKLASAKDAATYLQKHDLVQAFQDILQGLLAEKPEDPWKYVDNQIAAVKNKMSLPAAAVKDPTPVAPVATNKMVEPIEPPAPSGVPVEKKIEPAKDDTDGFGDDISPEEIAQSNANSSNRRGSQRGSVLSRSKVDTLMLKLTETSTNLSMVLPFLPQDFQDMLLSDDLAVECKRQFKELDKGNRGKLDAHDVLPVLMQLSTARQQSIGTDQARRFISMFNTRDDEGYLYMDDFLALVQFVMITAFLESDEGKQIAEVAKLEEKHFDEFISMISEDREKLWDIIPFLPDWMVDHVTGEEFMKSCLAQFEELDADKSGNLEPAELYPVVLNMTSAHPLAITEEKLVKFTKIFDVHNNFVIMKDEFVEFAQFLTVMSFLTNTEEGQAIKQQADLHDAKRRADTLLKILDKEPHRLPEYAQHLPKALRDELGGAPFMSAIKKTFQEKDVDKKDSVDPTLLFDCIITLTQPYPFRLNMERCKSLLEMWNKEKNAKLSGGQALTLVRFMVVVAFLEYSKINNEMVLAEILLGKDKIAKLLETLRTQADQISQVLPLLPESFRVELLSKEFSTQCIEDFKRLDADNSGVLEPTELLPIIQQLSTAHSFALTSDHACQFVDIFDTKRNGVITRDEYIEFVRFMLIMAYLDTEEGNAVSENVAIAKDEKRVEELLQSLERDRSCIHKVIPLLPAEIFEYLMGNDFVRQSHETFRSLNKSGTGKLTPEELFPIVVDLSAAHPFAVDIEKCKRFTKIFDVYGDGVIRLDEFVDFARFVCIMSFLNSSQGQDQVKDALRILDDHHKIENLLSMVEMDRHQVHKVLPFLPDTLRKELLSDTFVVECMAKFVALDVDKSGSLEPPELFPVVLSMAEANKLALDHIQCQRFTHIFDDTCSGTITKAEFVNFARFLMVMSFLGTKDGERALEQSKQPAASGRAPEAIEDGRISALADGRASRQGQSALPASPSDRPQAPSGPRPQGRRPQLSSVSAAKEIAPASPVAGHLVVDVEYYEQRSARLTEENDGLRKRLFDLESTVRRLDERMDETSNRIRHQDVDLRSARGHSVL